MFKKMMGFALVASMLTGVAFAAPAASPTKVAKTAKKAPAKTAKKAPAKTAKKAPVKAGAKTPAPKM